MTKEQYANKLSEMGIKATVVSGIIMMSVKDLNMDKKANKAIKEIGYKSSFGITIERSTDEKDKKDI